MNRDQAELDRRIREFSFDDPRDARPFSRRLAQEQRWTSQLTQRAIEEYRRFVLLAMTAGQPVCPSDAIDEVWHLHLLYTRDYWQRFCGELLGRPLHHEPSRGGADESRRHRTMYTQTLAVYRETFGVEPPEDLWPPLEQRFAESNNEPATRLARLGQFVNRRLASVQRSPVVAATACLLPLLAVDAPWLVGAGLNPLNLMGPQFLLFYAGLFCLTLMLAILARRVARWDDPFVVVTPGKFDAYEVAYLAGGTRRSINTAVARLVHAQRLHLISRTTPTLRQSVAGEPIANPFEAAVYERFADPSGAAKKLSEVYRGGAALCEVMRDRLRERGLLVSQQSALFGRLIPLALMFSLVGFGVLKIWIGVQRHRPVEFLIGACVATFVVAAFGFGRPLHRTLAGDRELAKMTMEYSALRYRVSQGEPSVTDAQFALAVGLFGFGILRNTVLGDVAKVMVARDSNVTGGGGCAGGGGGGCGGGGCGGGGCGGCGG